MDLSLRVEVPEIRHERAHGSVSGRGRFHLRRVRVRVRVRVGLGLGGGLGLGFTCMMQCDSATVKLQRRDIVHREGE